jgi:hypothetical protein
LPAESEETSKTPLAEIRTWDLPEYKANYRTATCGPRAQTVPHSIGDGDWRSRPCHVKLSYLLHQMEVSQSGINWEEYLTKYTENEFLAPH